MVYQLVVCRAFDKKFDGLKPSTNKQWQQMYLLQHKGYRQLLIGILYPCGEYARQVKPSDTGYTLNRYYMLQSSLQILHLPLLDDRTLRAGDLKSGSVIIEGFYHIKATACVLMYTCHVCIETQNSHDKVI